MHLIFWHLASVWETTPRISYRLWPILQDPTRPVFLHPVCPHAWYGLFTSQWQHRDLQLYLRRTARTRQSFALYTLIFPNLRGIQFRQGAEVGVYLPHQCADKLLAHLIITSRDRLDSTFKQSVLLCLWILSVSVLVDSEPPDMTILFVKKRW